MWRQDCFWENNFISLGMNSAGMNSRNTSHTLYPPLTGARSLEGTDGVPSDGQFLSRGHFYILLTLSKLLSWWPIFTGINKDKEDISGADTYSRGSKFCLRFVMWNG